MLRFDHHCPYINNCVGARNFRQFALMVGLNLMNINVGSLVIFIGTRSTLRSRMTSHSSHSTNLTSWFDCIRGDRADQGPSRPIDDAGLDDL